MRNSPCIKSAADIKGRELLVTFWQGRSDWISDSIHIVGPWTSFAISALVGLAISQVSLEVGSSSTPATILDSKKNHLPLSRNLEASVDGIVSSFVVSSNSRV